MNQHEWVYGCYAYYLENGYEPGNPEDGEWHHCHWPVPECKGGSKTVLLLKQHHAVHGVLQSEEWRHSCIYGWEADWVEGWLYERCKYWMAEKGRRVRAKQLAATTPEQRSEIARKRNESQTPEQRSERQFRAAETRRRNGRRSGAATPEALQRLKDSCSDRARKAHAGRTAEERSAIARKGHETRKRSRGERVG